MVTAQRRVDSRSTECATLRYRPLHGLYNHFAIHSHTETVWATCCVAVTRPFDSANVTISRPYFHKYFSSKSILACVNKFLNSSSNVCFL